MVTNTETALAIYYNTAKYINLSNSEVQLSDLPSITQTRSGRSQGFPDSKYFIIYLFSYLLDNI